MIQHTAQMMEHLSAMEDYLMDAITPCTNNTTTAPPFIPTCQQVNATATDTALVELMKTMQEMQKSMKQMQDNMKQQQLENCKHCHPQIPAYSKYCWSCGACCHNSTDCFPEKMKPGHQDSATFENKMGGSTQNCNKPCS